ncbi:GFA family protein [Mesorhizobium kowhaii]|uniref:GFA family protein n=1 Tax=Mesorhizobium kowhaii TaxID=1300272 RepID=UPI0035EDC709
MNILSHDLAAGNTMNAHSGGCHCGNVRLTFETGLDPSQIEVRACQCSFCVKHGSRAVADPDGRLIISVKDRAQLRTYHFGLRTADYLICRDCGVYVAAIAGDDDDARAIVIINALDDRERFDREPVPVDFDAEGREQRQARRRDRWMPVEMSFG